MIEVTPGQPSQDPERGMHFVFWRYVPGNIPAVLEEVSSAEVILLESAPTEHKRTKIVQEALMNHLLDAPLTRRQTTVLMAQYGPDVLEVPYEQVVEAALPMILPSLERAVLKRYHGTGKTVRLMDSNPEDQPEIAAEIKGIWQLITETNAMIRTPQPSSLSEIQKRQRAYLTAFSRTTRVRNALISEQLVEQREAFPDKRIAVIYGPLHSPISHPWLRSGRATRHFVDNIHWPAGVKQTYELDGEIIRRVMYEKPVPEELIVRSLLANSIVSLWAERRGQRLGSAVTDLYRYEDKTHDLEEVADIRARIADAAELAGYTAILETSFRKPTEASKAALEKFLEEL
jgi:hypothetical protein